jgi:hypothetical protein
MQRAHRMKLAVVAVALAAAATAARSAPAAGDQSPLAVVPAKAPLVIHAQTLETLADHAVAFLKNAVPDQADNVRKQADEFFKNGFDNGRKVRGVAKDGHLFLVFTELPKPNDKEEPKLALVVPVTSYADFRDNILKEDERKGLKDEKGGYQSTLVNKEIAYFVDKKDYAVLTPQKEVAELFAGKYDPLKIGKGQGDRLLKSDLGVYLNMDAFNKDYADQIKQAKKILQETFREIGNKAPKGTKGVFEAYQGLIDTLFQGIEDSRACLETAEIRASGVAFHVEDEWRPGSATADLLKGSKATAFKDLGKLPPGELYYLGMNTSPALAKLSGQFLLAMIGEPEGKQAKALVEAVEEFYKSDPGEVVAGFNLPPAGLSVMTPAAPEKLVAAQLKMYQAMTAGDSLLNMFFKGKPEVKEKVVKYKNFELNSAHFVWDFEKWVPPTGPGGRDLPEKERKRMAEFMKKVVGDEVNVWFGTDGKTVVQVTAKDFPTAQALLDQYTKGAGGAGDDKGFADVRKELPAEATVLVLIDAVGYANFVADMMRASFAETAPPGGPKVPPPIQGKTAYVGFAVTLDPERGSADFFVSAAAVKEVYLGYFAPLWK